MGFAKIFRVSYRIPTRCTQVGTCTCNFHANNRGYNLLEPAKWLRCKSNFLRGSGITEVFVNASTPWVLQRIARQVKTHPLLVLEWPIPQPCHPRSSREHPGKGKYLGWLQLELRKHYTSFFKTMLVILQASKSCKPYRAVSTSIQRWQNLLTTFLTLKWPTTRSLNLHWICTLKLQFHTS